MSTLDAFAAHCRACAADRLAGDPTPTTPRRTQPADVATRGAAACRAQLNPQEDA